MVKKEMFGRWLIVRLDKANDCEVNSVVVEQHEWVCCALRVLWVEEKRWKQCAFDALMPTLMCLLGPQTHCWIVDDSYFIYANTKKPAFSSDIVSTVLRFRSHSCENGKGWFGPFGIIVEWTKSRQVQGGNTPPGRLWSTSHTSIYCIH